MKRISSILVATVALAINVLSSLAQGIYVYPIDRVPQIAEGASLVFSGLPLYHANQLPMSLREFASQPMMHVAPELPPYYTHPCDFLSVKGIDKLDSVLIVSSEIGRGKIVYCYDSLANVQRVTISNRGGLYASVMIDRNPAGKEVGREIKYKSGEKVIYKMDGQKILECQMSDASGSKLESKITWTYKNSMAATCSATSTLYGKSSTSFSYTPERRLSSVKVKKAGFGEETTYEFSNYEMSVYNPIIYTKDEEQSAKRQHDVYTCSQPFAGKTFVRNNTLAEKNVMMMNGGDMDTLLCGKIFYRSLPQKNYGAKNMITSVRSKDVEGMEHIETYVYDDELRLSNIISPVRQVQFKYNERGNISMILSREGAKEQTIFFYYTNIEEERARIAAEKAAAEEAKRAAEQAAEDAKKAAEAETNSTNAPQEESK